ncbi:MAG: DUF1698 domain-containing protein [Acidobacteriota bacterium]
MDQQEILKRLSEIKYWYHRIELAPGVVTPGYALEPIWENTRKVRAKLDYQNKTVLDIASFDGMFSFEAERLGASLVVAADCLYKSFSNFLLCREVLGSRAVPYYNISPYTLSERLDVFFEENYESERMNDRRFDIVQHLGLLYHLRDPMLSLSQARSVLKPGGSLLIETDVVLDDNSPSLVFNGLPNKARLRDNYSVWWTPTIACLKEMLDATMFDVVDESVSAIEFQTPSRQSGMVSNADGKAAAVEHGYKMGRCALIAHARERGNSNEKVERELCRTYRNPGLDLARLGWG